ncbi:DUF975 family protein [Tissierella sp. MB52-C2]|uniref:DUF975 family protein n=1 Tax=Tissierella sp. MB52-C2 TaxID=3070999 RepID=UPI00280C04B0|nr:DUF975 family protein [Tissierella sp. MB52-C2]WMM24782.1 DUF975 family protein [Tissierella sp. MB52-C2]
MWNREYIKNYAKEFLRKHYWKAFLVCLIVSILSGGSNGGSSRHSERNYQEQTIYEFRDQTVFETNNPVINFSLRRLGRTPIFYLVWGSAAIVSIGLILLLITVGYNLEVGLKRFFLKGFKDDVNVRSLFSTFNSLEYFDIIKTQFLRSLYNLLWYFALIIPGIIKSYEYSMVPYILAEEPNLPSNEVIRRSIDMTDGHKWDMFVLDLSFIGWYILGLFFFGIGEIFVNPYKEATVAKLYNIISGNDEIDGMELLE